MEKMARTFTENSVMIAMVFTLLVSFSGFGVGQSVPQKPPLQFTYYLHDNFIPPGVTAVTTIALNGNYSGMSQFGDQSAFNSLLKVTADRNSTLIGHHSGITSMSNQPNLFFITLTAELNHPFKYTGFYTMQGRFNSSLPSWDLVITGGTGSFLGARGYSKVTVVDPDFVRGLIIRYDVNMVFCGF